MSKMVKKCFVVAGLLLAVALLICLTSCSFGKNGFGYGKTYLRYSWIGVNSFSDNNPSIPSTVYSSKWYEVEKGTYTVKWGYSCLEYYINYKIEANTGLFPEDKNFKLSLNGYNGVCKFTYTEGDRSIVNMTSIENPVMYKTAVKDDNVEYCTPIETGVIDADGVTITWEYGRLNTQE